MTAKDGNACKKCGGEERYKDGRCIPCAKERANRWKQANPERRREYNRHYEKEVRGKRRRNKSLRDYERQREYDRRRYWANPEKRRATWRNWKQTNLDRIREKDRRWYDNNRERKRSSQRRWLMKNRDRAIANAHRYRTKKSNAGGSYTHQQWHALCLQYDSRCLRCGRADVPLTADHVLPVSRGGSSDISNIQPLCKSCNSAKGSRHIDYRTKPLLSRPIQLSLFVGIGGQQ